MKQTCSVVFATALLLSIVSTPTLAKSKKTKQQPTPTPISQTAATDPSESATPAPVTENSLVARARTLEGEQQYDQAIALYREHLTQQPMDDEARALLARRLAWQGHYDEAAVLYEDILHRYPQNGDVRVAFARVKAWQKHYSEAQAMLKSKNLPRIRVMLKRNRWPMSFIGKASPNERHHCTSRFLQQRKIQKCKSG